MDSDEGAPELRHWIAVIAVNVAMLVELGIAMYFAAANPATFAATFMKVFFGMLVPTLVVFVLVKRRLRR